MPNEDGRLALYTLSSYSLESLSEGKEIRILDLENGKSALFSDDPRNKDIQWLGTDRLLWLRETTGGSTELWSGTVVGEKEYAYLHSKSDGLRLKSLVRTSSRRLMASSRI